MKIFDVDYIMYYELYVNKYMKRIFEHFIFVRIDSLKRGSKTIYEIGKRI